MSKLKRPEKIQTAINGSTGTSSTTTSPSLSAKRPPSAPILPPGAVRNNPALSNGVSRTAIRPNRDAPTQALGRGQRTSSSGLRSASIAIDTTIAQKSQPQPYIQSDAYILKKYQGSPASLIVHLHPTHFRFDQQDGTFTYKSPMKMFLEHLRTGTVPYDLMEYFTLWGVPFYEGCLIVEVHDHKSVAAIQEPSQTTASPEKTDPFSIHNYNNYLTPSSWVPYPKENLTTLSKITAGSDKASDEAGKTKSASDKDKENMPAPGQPAEPPKTKAPPKKARITTIVLHPTALSAHIDLVIKATTPLPASTNARRESRQDAPLSATSQRPQTPMIAIPSTPHLGMDPPPAKRVKRERMELDSKNVYQAQSQITLATTAPLFLEPLDSAEESAQLLEALKHPEHSSAVPSPKVRKKTVAEMAAEESAAADEEKYMLVLDERYSNGAPGGTNAVDGDGQVGGTSFEPRFERFKTIEAIKLQVIENKKKEKIQQAEAAKRQQQEGEARERARAEAAKRQEEEQRQRNIQIQQQQQLQAQRQQAAQEMQRRQMAQQAAQQGQQNIQVAQAQMNQGQAQHGLPAQPMTMATNMTNNIAAQQQRFLQQQNQMSQAQASSPVVRNSTPHNLSSPMVASNIGASMQQSTSSIGGSPPRPGSVVQPQMTPAMAHAMRAQSSQQSQGGTPRPLNATPNMAQAMPRQISQTPRMSQASPMPGNMIQTPQMAQMMPNGQMMNAQLQQAQIIAQQQAQQQRMRQQAVQQAMGSSPPNGQQMTPQQYAAMQQQMQQQSQANPGMMNASQMSAQYAAQMRAMAAAQAQGVMQQGQGQPNFVNANGMNANGMTQQQMMAAAQAQQQQQQAQAQVQQQQQQQLNPLQQQIRAIAAKLYRDGLPNLTGQWNGQPPAELLNQFRQQCHQRATSMVRQNMNMNMLAQQQGMRQQHQMMAAQQAAAQQAAAAAQQQGMGNMNANMNMNGNGNINMNGMGMQRPPGM